MAGLLKCPDCGEIFDSVDSGNCQIALDEGWIDECCPACGFHITGCDELDEEDDDQELE